jgi:hypothetical protein
MIMIVRRASDRGLLSRRTDDFAFVCASCHMEAQCIHAPLCNRAGYIMTHAFPLLL